MKTNKTYCYSTRHMNSGQKQIGGMLHADSLDDAAKAAAQICGLTVEITGTDIFPRHRYRTKRGEYVYLFLSLPPEYMSGLPVDDKRGQHAEES